MQIISLGEVLWDIFDDQELLGGAPLNFSASLQRLGHTVALVTGVGTDDRGRRTLDRMAELNLSLEFVEQVPDRATGTAVVTLDHQRHATFVIPRPSAFDAVHVTPGLSARLAALGAEWLYFGTLAMTNESTLELLLDIVRNNSKLRVFYDMNLRTGHWSLPLVEHLSALANVLKLNDEEAELLFGLEWPEESFSLEDFCRHWAARHDIGMICVTLGSKGCAIFTEGRLETFPGFAIKVADTVGAGDAFAAGFVHALSQPWTLKERAAFANGLGALVASRSGATPQWTIAECQALVAQQLSAAPHDGTTRGTAQSMLPSV
jgi:fructokinase